MTKPKFNPEEPPSDDSELEGDTVPALLASLLMMMCCPTCEGTGMVGEDGPRCKCRDFGYEVAMSVFKEEGLV